MRRLPLPFGLGMAALLLLGAGCRMPGSRSNRRYVLVDPPETSHPPPDHAPSVVTLAPAVPIAPTPPKPVSPSPPPQPAPPHYAFQDALAIQVFLDRAHYSPGCLDGIVGSKTRQAVRAWQTGNSLPVNGDPDVVLARLDPDRSTYMTEHVVSDRELSALTEAPQSWVARSEMSFLGYETLLETVAEKYHATQGAIRRLNPDAAWPDPPAGTKLRVPNPGSSRSVQAALLRIDLRAKTISAYDANGRLVALFPCSIARDPAKRPAGQTLKIVNAADMPVYYYDSALFSEDPESRTLKGKKEIPPGPNNPVGTAWISLSLPGYGIHGTPKPEDIGKTESHGCFRLANWNAEKLIRFVRGGMPVQVD